MIKTITASIISLSFICCCIVFGPIDAKNAELGNKSIYGLYKPKCLHVGSDLSVLKGESIRSKGGNSEIVLVKSKKVIKRWFTKCDDILMSSFDISEFGKYGLWLINDQVGTSQSTYPVESIIYIFRNGGFKFIQFYTDEFNENFITKPEGSFEVIASEYLYNGEDGEANGLVNRRYILSATDCLTPIKNGLSFQPDGKTSGKISKDPWLNNRRITRRIEGVVTKCEISKEEPVITEIVVKNSAGLTERFFYDGWFVSSGRNLINRFGQIDNQRLYPPFYFPGDIKRWLKNKKVVVETANEKTVMWIY